ncbi:carbohydrate sulfotransferase 3-like [Asterias amurensis]|uniref:carbohydrate sulfotransferase 3-like n=1 Tax=Asterias amurensis TaxID=7602 RepID=UPI003AB42E39
MPYNRSSFFIGFALSSAIWIILGTLILHPPSLKFPPTCTDSIDGNLCASETPPKGKTCILILASLRTGSSFVGELFANNRDVFYLFEPGLDLGKRLNHIRGGKQLTENVLLRMIQDLFRCDFTNLHFYLRWLSKLSENLLQGTCTITENVARVVCQSSRYIAIKTIRIPDMSLVLPIAERNALNLRVVHLVRDPRPMIASRFLALTHQRLSSASFANTSRILPNRSREFLSIYCKYNWQNFEIGSRNPTLKQNYMFVRYEDAAVDPLTTVKRLYRFINKTEVPSASVLKWIELNTNCGNEKGLYSTSRNSTAVYQRWRRTLPFRLAKEIEGVGQCRDMMIRMGYFQVKDEVYLRNMSLPLIGDAAVINHPKHSWLWF